MPGTPEVPFPCPFRQGKTPARELRLPKGLGFRVEGASPDAKRVEGKDYKNYSLLVFILGSLNAESNGQTGMDATAYSLPLKRISVGPFW